jgi:hypothetical protein
MLKEAKRPPLRVTSPRPHNTIVFTSKDLAVVGAGKSTTKKLRGEDPDIEEGSRFPCQSFQLT